MSNSCAHTQQTASMSMFTAAEQSMVEHKLGNRRGGGGLEPEVESMGVSCAQNGLLLGMGHLR